MALNIKNQRVCDLAREAARRTGKSQVSVIEEALERMLREHDETLQNERRAKLERINALVDEFNRDLTDEDRANMSTDWLYDDETGLPR